ncbi:MAG TPA: metal-dependent hydrolase [Planctomycetaceae bacterium]|jgi:L-ascorbate metabolism protein UlaG (beta-lactamase superfamily)
MKTSLTWHGHSAWQIDTAGKWVQIDPFLTGNPAAKVAAASLGADFILVSHGHNDHVGDTVAIAKRTGATVIANFEITEWMTKQGVPHVHPMNTGGARTFPFGNLKLTIAHHTSMLPDGANGGNPCGFLIRLTDGRKIYHAADTGLFVDMQLIGEEGIDLAILPIGDNYTMGPDDALRAVRLIQPQRVIPTHFGTWDLIAQDAAAWAARVKSETAAEPIVLKPGETFVF